MTTTPTQIPSDVIIRSGLDLSGSAKASFSGEPASAPAVIDAPRSGGNMTVSQRVRACSRDVSIC